LPQWIVVYSHPNQEHIVRDVLGTRGIETYLPIVNPARPRRGRRPELPFFPRYLFARVDLDRVACSSLMWTAGVVCVVSFDSKPAVVDQAVVDHIKRRVAEFCGKGWGTTLQQGDRVRITSGALRDLEGIFDKTLSGSGRVRVLLNVLGRMTACSIGIDALERIPPASAVHGETLARRC
jgi:transcriptional antiterminator RfaH